MAELRTELRDRCLLLIGGYGPEARLVVNEADAKAAGLDSPRHRRTPIHVPGAGVRTYVEVPARKALRVLGFDPPAEPEPAPTA